MKSSKTARVLTLIYLVGVVVKIEPIVVEELRLLIIVGCCAGRQCDLPLQQGLLGPGEQGAHLRQSQPEDGRRRLDLLLMPLRRRRRVHTLQLQEQF